MTPTLRTAVLLPLALHAAAVCAEPGDCVSGSTPRFLSAQPQGQFPITAQAPTQNGAQLAFYVRDANGNTLRGVEVELTTPLESPTAALWSDAETPSSTPRRVVVRTSEQCVAVASFVGDSLAGTYVITARILADPSVAESIVVTQAHADYSSAAPISAGTVARSGTPHAAPKVQLRSTRGFFGFAAVRFDTPPNGSSGRFANGTNSTIVSANAFGIAAAPMTAGDIVGEFTVQAIAEGFGTAVELGPYVNVRDTALSFSLDAMEFTFGAATLASANVRFPGLPCGLLERERAYVPTRFSFRIGGIAYASNVGSPGNCTPSEVAFRRDIGTWPFGTHEITAEYAGHAAFSDSRMGPLRFTVLPAFQAATPAGSVKMGIGATSFAEDLGACNLRSARVAALGGAGMPSAPPPGVQLPHGLLAYDIDACAFTSGVGSLRRPGVQRMLLEFDRELPALSGVWTYVSTAAEPAPRWREIPASIVGNRALVRLANGGDGDETPSSDDFIRGILAVGVRGATQPANYQDLWWAGPSENGWGLTISQHGERLFIALFIYDAQGKPRWVVLPAGQWNAGFTAYSGALYRPRGSFFRNYSVAAFDVGASVGTATVTFQGSDTATLAFTIDGISGTKSIRRQGFGGPDPVPLWRFDDLWWGGVAQNGWGVAIAQQFQSLFAVWFTYDEAGETTWMVIPEGRFTGDFSFFGTAYTATGSRWLGVPYNAQAFAATSIGDAQIFFRSRDSAQLRLLDSQLRTTFTLELARQPF